jgi:lysozyme
MIMALLARQLLHSPKRKKHYRKFFPVLVLLTGLTFIFTLAFGSSLYKYANKAYSRAAQALPWLPGSANHGFGVSIPRSYTTYGIDVSHHQGKINWSEVVAMDVGGKRISFVFIKATEGITRKDNHYDRNWKKAGEAGLMRGAYHYFHPSRDAAKQARNFINNVKLQPGDLPPVLDIEVTNRKSKSEIVSGAREWCRLVEEYYGVKPLIYTSPGYFTSYLAGEFDDYLLWIAHYHSEKPRTGKHKWHFWQHTDKASVNGIRGYVDLNVYKGDSGSLQKLCIKKIKD